MAAAQAVEYDASGTPLQATEYDASGNPIGVSAPKPKATPVAPLHVTPDIASDIFKAGVHSKMLGVTPAQAYDAKDEIQKQLGERGGSYDDGKLDDSIYNDVMVGLEGSVSGLIKRNKLPDQVANPGKIDKLWQGIGQMIGDAPWMLAGGAAGGAAGSEVPVLGNAVGAGVGAFAIPAVMREALVQGLQHGKVQSMSDLLRRSAAVVWAGTKGAVVGAATELTGGLAPVIGKGVAGTIATTAVKGLYQAAALTTAADLLEGHLPTAGDFAGNAALIVPLNLITHGMAMTHPEAKQATMDVYAKTGKTPAETTETLNAQPPVKPDMPEGLRPAIQTSDGVTEGETTDTHDKLAERVLGKRPVSLEKLEADPELADDVLQNPTVHDQDVIDRAWQLKSEALAAGDVPVDQGGGIEPVASEPTMRDHLANFLERVGTRMAREQYGQGILDDMEQAGENPQEVSKQFWTKTYFDMPAEAQTMMQRQLKAQTGMEPGDVIMVKADGTPVVAKDWADIAEHILDLPDNAADLEGTARGIVAMMRDAQDRFGENAKPEAPQPTPRAQLPTPKPLRIEDLYDRASMKSGRGFVTPDGQFFSRMEARKWMKDNEPDTHELWLESQNGDKQAELHTEDYAAARNRAANRNLAQGDPQTDAMPPDIKRFLAEARSETGILNKVKAGLASAKYGYEAIRTLLVGPRNMLRANGEQIVSGLRKLVPDKVDQQALHFARDYRDAPDQLRSDIEEIRAGDNEKLKAFIPAMERALEPMSPEMAQADAQMTDYFTKALALGRAAGTLDSAVDPSRYSPRMFMRATEEGQPTTGVGRSPFTDKTVNSIRRDYLHTLDPLKSGDTEARTFNAFDEMSIYNDRHATAVSTALFKTELRNSALGVEGSRDKVPADWVPLTKQFEDRRTFVQDDGSQVTTVKNLYVPKDIAAALKPLLEDPGQLSQLAKFLHVQSIIKGMELGLSAFHIKALNVTAFNNLGFKQFATAAFKDIHDPDTLAIEQRGALYGLTTTKTGMPVDAYLNIKSDVEATGLAKLADNAIVNKVKATSEAISKYTFDTVQRKWKVMDYAKKEAGWVASHPEASESEYATAMRGYAKEINAAYGGLNWDVMGASKGIQNVSRMFLLAPDWTFSNVANLKYAFTDAGTAGASSRAFFLKSFMTGFAATAAASIYIGGKYDPTDVKHLDQVYLGTDKDGKEMYANWFFAGAPKDAMNLVKRSYSEGPIGGLTEVMLSKAAPIAGAVVDVAKNKDYKGAPITTADQTDLEKTGKQAQYVGEKVLPITGVSAAKTVYDALSDPTHEYSYTDILEMAADAAGSPTIHSGGASGGGGNSAKRFQSTRTSGKSGFTIRGR
jgi:hypothetical protein